MNTPIRITIISATHCTKDKKCALNKFNKKHAFLKESIKYDDKKPNCDILLNVIRVTLK
jgi:hypothetical protein